jgi:formylmethanofuran--tetrahydromethanopterin N-formyltransferase
VQFNGVEIEETFAEAFPMVVGRILVTAANPTWAMTAGKTATGFASSIIMSPAEAAVEGCTVPPEKTPDGRPGVYVQMWHWSRRELKLQMITRIGQCILTCPTTAAFDALPDAVRKLKIGLALRKFGDGFQKRDKLGDRNVWRIPVMEGEFIIEDRFGVKKGVAGGNFIIMANSQAAALRAAEEAVQAMAAVEGVVLPFPGGICRSGSKVGSIKYKLPASTNHPFCPTLRASISDSKVPENVQSVYELVFNGLNTEIVEKATGVGVAAAAKTPGVVKITAVNFGGKLGPYQIRLVDALKDRLAAG